MSTKEYISCPKCGKGVIELTPFVSEWIDNKFVCPKCKQRSKIHWAREEGVSGAKAKLQRLLERTAKG